MKPVCVQATHLHTITVQLCIVIPTQTITTFVYCWELSLLMKPVCVQATHLHTITVQLCIIVMPTQVWTFVYKHLVFSFGFLFYFRWLLKTNTPCWWFKWNGIPTNYRMTAFTYENIQAVWNVCIAEWLHALGNGYVQWDDVIVCKIPASLIGFNEVHFLWELVIIG